jgi:hypothetical protein
MIIGSIAPAYRLDKRIRGHEVSFQTDLRAAARARGDDLFILVPAEIDASAVDAQDGIVACLPDRKDPIRCLAGVRQWLAEVEGAGETTVLLYEGALAWLPAFDVLAADHPRVRFIVNLFFPEAALNTPSTSIDAIVQPVPVRVREQDNRAAMIGAHRPSPQSNVTVLAETEERRFLAEALGVAVAGVWPLHSLLSASPVPARSLDASRPIRVLIPLAPRQVKPRVMRDIDFITRQVDRATVDRRIDWTIAGPLARDARAMRVIGRALRSGLALQPEELELGDYAALFAAHDAVWFPIRGHYTTQSSGKALDALVTGTPIVAPAGSYAAKQQQRWLPGAPAYDGSREAVELLLRLPVLIAGWQRALSDCNGAIRTTYSAATALEVLLDHSGAASRTRAPGPPAGASRPKHPEPSVAAGRLQKHRMRLTEAFDVIRAFFRFARL